MFFHANLSLERKGQCEISLSSLDQATQTEIWQSSHWQKLLPFVSFCQFFQDAIFRLQSKWGIPASLNLITETVEEK